MLKYLLLALILTGCAHTQLTQPQQAIKSMSQLRLTSPAFQDQGLIPAKYTCDGEDINPPLLIEGVGEDAKSLVLIVDDPDASMGTWVHWVVLNIDPETAEIPENSAPAGSLELKTSFDKPGYGGPCPHTGTHRYFFKLYALDAPKINSAEEIPAHTIASAELIGLYQRRIS